MSEKNNGNFRNLPPGEWSIGMQAPLVVSEKGDFLDGVKCYDCSRDKLGMPGKMGFFCLVEGEVPPELLDDPDWKTMSRQCFDEPWCSLEDMVFSDLTGREIDTFGDYVRECSSEEDGKRVFRDVRFTYPVDGDTTIRVFWK